MSSFIIDSSTLSGWYTLIKEACKTSVIDLPEDIESYLIFLLMRFTNQPEFANSVLGSEYLEALNKHLHLRQACLKDVGDKCLLMSGLFPARAQKKWVKISYFVKLGQSAYTILGHIATKEPSAIFYATLSERFVAMMDILQTTRELDAQHLPRLSPLEAYELWNDTNSDHARKSLQSYTNFQTVRSLIKKDVH